MAITRNVRRLLGGAEALTPNATPTAIASPWTTGDLKAVVWADILDSEHVPATRAEAMAVPAVAKARHVLCTTIARLPLHAYRGDAQVPQADEPAWIARTDTPVSPYHRMLWTIDDLIFGGWSLWMTDLDSEGRPLSAVHVNAEDWHFDAAHRVVLDRPLPANAGLVLIPGPHEGILSFGRRTVRTAARLESAAAIAAETPDPTLELHDVGDQQLTDPEIDKLIARWRAARKVGGVSYTSKGIELKTHGTHPENLLVEGRNAAAVDVARSVGVPASSIDATPAGSSLTYSTTEMRNRELVDYGMAGYMAAVTSRLSLDDMTARGLRVRFDLEEFLPVTPLSAGGDQTREDDPEQ